jgi:hypothetical protein
MAAKQYSPDSGHHFLSSLVRREPKGSPWNGDHREWVLGVRYARAPSNPSDQDRTRAVTCGQLPAAAAFSPART